MKNDSLPYSWAGCDRFRTLRTRHGFTHPRFGDLAAPEAVVMPRHVRMDGDYVERDDIIVHLTVTGRCNARCNGCVNTSLTMGRSRDEWFEQFDTEPARDAAIVERLAALNPDQSLLVALYGGEPLLEMEKVNSLVAAVSRSPSGTRTQFMLYSNGQLLAKAVAAHPSVFAKMRLVSISIDGEPGQHALFRPGTDVSTIVAGLEVLRTVYTGTVLMWSTLREGQSLLSCFRQFLELHRNGLADQMFWHWADSPEPFRSFSDYACLIKDELETVVEHYVRELNDGRLLPLVHLNELVLYLLTGRRRGHSACAVERAENFDIIGGRLSACADLPPEIGRIEIEDLESGDIAQLGFLVSYRDRLGCNGCGVDPYCGGRCPVQVLAGAPERTLQVCQLMRMYVGTMLERIGEIEMGLRKAGIGLQDIYDRSACFARYTDVVP